ncbi:MAG: SPOR domain-containing protein [Bacteroidetes bacterium]|nr:SPOR domain-containing protein [Bacteroidota bacterium]
MIKFIFAVFFLIQSQSPNDIIKEKILSVYNGNAENILKELPTLETKYPNNASVIYLKAILTVDGAKAVKMYEQIVNQFRESEWADDALYRIYEYNYAIGLYKRSDEIFSKLKEQFPNSEYLQIPQKKVGLEKQTLVFEEKEENNLPSEISKETENKISPFAVQVGAFVNEENAKVKANFFKSLGKKTSIQKKETTTILFVVVVEGFETEKSAREFIIELKQKHQIDAFFVKR